MNYVVKLCLHMYNVKGNNKKMSSTLVSHKLCNASELCDITGK